MCDCNDPSGDCQLCVCGRGVSGADAEALTAQLLQNVGAEQAARQGLNLQIDRNVLDKTLAKVVAQRNEERKGFGFGLLGRKSSTTSSLKKTNVTIGSTSTLGEKKSIFKSLSKAFFDESKTQKDDKSKTLDTQTSNVTKSASKSNVSQISATKSTVSDTKSAGQIKLEKQIRQRTKDQDYREHVDADIVETIAKRVGHAEKANKLNNARVRYEKKAKVMEKQEKDIVSHLSQQKKKADETRGFREQQKKEAKERQLRTIHRTDAFVDHEEQRDEEFAQKKEAEEAEERERLTKAAKYMPPKINWGAKILAFAGTTLLAAGIIGLVFRCLNITLFKESAQTAVDNVITAIVEGSQAIGQSGEWAFGPGGGGKSGCVPRRTRKTPKIIDSKRKWPIERPPMKFAIPGMNNCDEGEEGDFLFDDEEEIYEDDNPTDSTTA